MVKIANYVEYIGAKFKLDDLNQRIQNESEGLDELKNERNELQESMFEWLSKQGLHHTT